MKPTLLKRIGLILVAGLPLVKMAAAEPSGTLVVQEANQVQQDIAGDAENWFEAILETQLERYQAVATDSPVNAVMSGARTLHVADCPQAAGFGNGAGNPQRNRP